MKKNTGIQVTLGRRGDRHAGSIEITKYLSKSSKKTMQTRKM